MMLWSLFVTTSEDQVFDIRTLDEIKKVKPIGKDAIIMPMILRKD
jgi:hypothetical protein